MILVRQVFQIKYGHMDAMLALVRAAEERGGPSANMLHRVLTDISGPNFTLVFETVVESIDEHGAQMQAVFADPDSQADAAQMAQYIESGHREFYTIEWEASG